MSVTHTSPHALHNMEMEYHRHPFGDNHQAMKAMVQPLPAGFYSHKQLDYDVRTDDSPVYVGFAEVPFTSDDDEWIIQKFTYDGSNRVTKIEVANGTWTNRASLFT